MRKSRYSGWKLDLRQVLRDIKTMERNQKLKKEGKLGILFTLDDVARKHNSTREAINYLRKRYKHEQISSEEDSLSRDKDKQKEPKTMFGVDTDFYFKWTGGKEFVTTDKTTGIPYFDYKKVWAWIEAYKNEEVKRA